MRSRPNKGFTLIELMIVVAIIGILASVALPKFAELSTRAKEATFMGNLGNLRSALAIYYSNNNGQYPESLSSLTANSEYMNALPNFQIPQNSATGNPGHSSLPILSPNCMAPVLIVPDSGMVLYDGCGSYGGAVGDVHILCNHKTSRGADWSSY